MGIKGLSELIANVAPASIKEYELKNLFGRTIAIDASMSLYQFLIAIRAEGTQLVSIHGETTSHLMGTFYRTIRLIENGIKPVYVFDGKPPDLKGGELAKRAFARQEAEKQLEKAKEEDNRADLDKFNRRLVRVTKKHIDEVKDLLKLMGVPYIEAPSEAEAQCAAMVKAGQVYATATEDMDALTFGSNILLRYLTFSEARKMQIVEYRYSKVLEGLELNQDQFIDLSILLGCDYCDHIKGIGSKKGLALLTKYKTIEKIIENLDKTKYVLPEDWNFKEARKLFKSPTVTDPSKINLKWSNADEEGLVKFLCGDMQFNEERVRSGAMRLLKAKRIGNQTRLDTFFPILPSSSSNPPVKRKCNKDGNKPVKRVYK